MGRRPVSEQSALAYLNEHGARLRYEPAWLSESEANRLRCRLEASLHYPTGKAQQIRRPFSGGGWVEIPRRQAAYGDPGAGYRFSGCRLDPQPWCPVLAELRQSLAARLGIDFNFVLVNLYRDGADRMGWHADDESELGPEPEIASLSLGARRDFQLRHRDAFSRAGRPGSRPDLETVSLSLAHGSLLHMRAPTQRDWLHQLPRRGGRAANKIGPRINLTFRRVDPRKVDFR